MCYHNANCILSSILPTVWYIALECIASFKHIYEYNLHTPIMYLNVP